VRRLQVGEQGQIFGGAKNFCPNFPKLARNNFGPLVVGIISHDDCFRDDLQKKVFMFILHTSGTISVHIFREFVQIFRYFAKVFTDFAQISADFARIFRDFPGFSTNQNFWGCAWTSCTPPPPTPMVVTVQGCETRKMHFNFFIPDNPKLLVFSLHNKNLKLSTPDNSAKTRIEIINKLVIWRCGRVGRDSSQKNNRKHKNMTRKMSDSAKHQQPSKCTH